MLRCLFTDTDENRKALEEILAKLERRGLLERWNYLVPSQGLDWVGPPAPVSESANAVLSLGGPSFSLMEMLSIYLSVDSSFKSMIGGLVHELGNPLSTANMTLELMFEQIDTAEIRLDDKLLARLNRLAHETRRARSIVNAFADYVWIDEPKAAQIALSELLDSLVESCQGSLMARNVGIHRSFEENLSANIDGRQITLALLNIMKNAIEATPDGGVVNLAAWSDVDSVTIEVIDSGHGIHEEVKPRIFEAFFSTKLEHIGLGLALSRKIVAAHGGTIDVESQYGVGSSFRVRLPGSKPSPHNSPQEV
jgi:two-component system, NtrC family, sensor histidine kinase HydH